MDNNSISERLLKRAQEYEGVYCGNHKAFLSSASYPIATALRELAMILEKDADQLKTILNRTNQGGD